MIAIPESMRLVSRAQDQILLERLDRSNKLDGSELKKWRILALILVTTLGIVAPWAISKWSGFHNDMNQVIPPVLYLDSWGAVLTFTYFLTTVWSNFLPQPTSWYIAYWRLLLVELACTFVCFSTLLYWIVFSYHSDSSIDAGSIMLNSIVALILCVELFFTRITFKMNHVVLVLCVPALWIVSQVSWIYTGHRNCYADLTFQTYKSTMAILAAYLLIFVIYFLLQRLAHFRNSFYPQLMECTVEKSVETEGTCNEPYQSVMSSRASQPNFKSQIDNSTYHSAN